MARAISSEQELQNRLNEIMRVALQKISIEISHTLQRNLNELWYSRNYNPNYSSRSGDVVDSITVSTPAMAGRFIRATVYFDESKIIPRRSDKVFNQHMSLDGSTEYQGRSIGSWVIEWMEKGQNSPVHSYSGVGFFHKTEEQISGPRGYDLSLKMLEIAKQEFRKHGIRIT